MPTYPQDTLARKVGSKGCQILHGILDTDHWEYKQETGNDVGRDCILELSENNQWRNHKLEGQIKGRQTLKEIDNNAYISFQMQIKTINYALQSPIAFVLFLVDTKNEIVYYQPIQEYVIANPELLRKLSSEQKTIAIHIPKTQVLPDDDGILQELARKMYRPQEDALPQVV